MSRLDLRIVGRQRGFTLVEMLVVLALMLVLAALAVALVPRMTERAKTARGASQLQGWLLIARMWAKRDNTPTGIRLQAGRLYPNPATPNGQFVTDLQYIQQPPPYHAYDQASQTDSQLTAYPASSPAFPPPYLSTDAGKMLKATFVGGTTLVDFYGGNQRGTVLSLGPPTIASNQPLWLVQPGDYLEMPTGGMVFKITDVVPDPPPNDPIFPTPPGQPGDVLVLSQSHNLGTISVTDYRVIRGPRVLPGEQALQMPQDVAIDTSTNQSTGIVDFSFHNPLPTNPNTGDVDILFAPSGAVISRGLSTDKIILWVRDVSQDGAVQPGAGIQNMPAGDQSLVVIYVRTGFIASHQVYSGANTLSRQAVSPGVEVQMTVADPTDIKPDDYLIIDVTNPLGTPSTNQETQQVKTVSGNTVIFKQMMFAHAYNCRVISDPYSYVRNAKSSGM